MKRIITILAILLASTVLTAQGETKSKETEVFFGQSEYIIDPYFHRNRESLDELVNFIEKLQADSLTTILRIEIDGFTSPEGGRSYNKKLSKQRTEATYSYLRSTTTLPESLYTINHSGIDWEGLHQMVEASSMKYRNEVLYILNTVPEETWRRVNPNDKWPTLVDSRSKHMMDLRGGRPYRYIFEHFYPELRRGSVVTVYFKSIAPVVSNDEPLTIERFDTPSPQTMSLSQLTKPIELEEVMIPIAALKTNLLFDAATLVNLELEIPIGKRFSLAAEMIYPWWTWDDGTENSKRDRIQLFDTNFGIKYWFGDRTNRPVLTGWYAGLYAGGGFYDFERNTVGYQGEFFITAGADVGYAHTINKSGSLRMEYSLGLGYLQTDYRYYDAHYSQIHHEWHPIIQEVSRFKWLGPTRARVSLVWLPSIKKRGGVGR